MTALMPPPEVLLPDMASLLVYLENDEWTRKASPCRYRVKSQVLCDAMDAKEKAEGFQYNREFMRWFEKEHGLPEHAESGSALSILVYNAQAYRRSDALFEEGFAPLTQTMIDEAARKAAAIELRGENMLGGNARRVYRVRAVGGQFRAMLPRSRKRCLSPNGAPARIVSTGAAA